MTICKIDWSNFEHPLATLSTLVTNPLVQVTTLLPTHIWARGWSNFDHPLHHMRDPLTHIADPLTHMSTLCTLGKGVRG
jgi:hypothetical protein